MLTLWGINILHRKRHWLLIIEINWLIFLLMLLLLLLLLLLSKWGSGRYRWRIRRALCRRIVHILVRGFIIIRAIITVVIIIVVVGWRWVKWKCRLIEHYMRGKMSHHLLWHNHLLMLLHSLTGIGRCSSWAVTSWWWRRRVRWSNKW